MAIHLAQPFHPGELRMHTLLSLPPHDNPTVPCLSPHAANLLSRAPLLALGGLDRRGWPWTTLWGGEPGLAGGLGGDVVGVTARVEGAWDPVVGVLFRAEEKGEGEAERDGVRLLSALAIDLDQRRRVKLCGRVVAGKLDEEGEEAGEQGCVARLAVVVTQSLGNCPKYLNRKRLRPAASTPRLASTSTLLAPDALALIERADIFFLTTSNGTVDLDTNHRGGAPGFVRCSTTPFASPPAPSHPPSSPSASPTTPLGESVLQTDTTPDPTQTTQITWPEYSGNRLYQSLGNILTTPRAGLVFPCFATGDVLYVTGTAEVLVGNDAAEALPRSNLAVRVTVVEARFVKAGLPMRADPPGGSAAAAASPYNPPVRRLRSEISQQGAPASSLSSFFSASGAAGDNITTTTTATLVALTRLTPTITRLRFSLSRPRAWTAGQWVALDLAEAMGEGHYSHMRDDDPRGLNDDHVRTFTVSSPPLPPPPTPSASRPGKGGQRKEDDWFEITIRTVGRVTAWLARLNPRASVEVRVLGFGGALALVDPPPPPPASPSQQGPTTQPRPPTAGATVFVAAGIGITPFLACASSRVCTPDAAPREIAPQVLWTLRAADLGLALDAARRVPHGSGGCWRLFVTGLEPEDHVSREGEAREGEVAAAEAEATLRELDARGITVAWRRFGKADVEALMDAGNGVRRWVVCCGRELRAGIESWVGARGEVVFEDFDF